MSEGSVGTRSERSEYEDLLEQVTYQLQAYHRTKGTDSRQGFAIAEGELERATRTLFELIDRGVPVVLQLRDTTPRLHDTEKNAYDFVSLGSWRTADPGEMLALHLYNTFRDFDGPESYVGGFCDNIKIKDLAEALCEGACLVIDEDAAD